MITYKKLTLGVGFDTNSVGKQKKKEEEENLYTENKIGRYVQFLIEREDFLELVASWLLSIEDERICSLLRQFIFEVELSENQEELKNVFVSIWGYLTEKNYLEKSFHK